MPQVPESGKPAQKVSHWVNVENNIHACTDIRRHCDKMEMIVKKDGWGMRFAHPIWYDQRPVILAAVSNYGMALEFSTYTLCNDKEIVETAIKNNGMAFMYASDELKNNKEMVLKAVSCYGPVVEFASLAMRQDPDVMLMAIAHGGSALMFARELREDKIFCIEALKHNSECLNFIDPELRNDPDIVKAFGDAAKNQRKTISNFRVLRQKVHSPHPPPRPSVIASNSMKGLSWPSWQH